MPISLQFLSATMACYLVNFQGKNFTVLVDQQNKVKIQQPTGTFKQWRSIKNAVLNIHSGFAS